MKNLIGKLSVARLVVLLFLPIGIVVAVLANLVQAEEPYQVTSNQIDQIIIPSDGSMVESAVSLENNVRYSIVVTGTFRYDAGDPFDFADAQYFTQDEVSWSRSNWVEFDNIRLDANVLDLDNHTHTFYITGKGQPLSLSIYDSNYGDNSGSLTATIYPYQQGIDRDPYANVVLGYEALGSGNTHTDPATVLGPPSCGTFDLSLGGGWVEVDMGEGEEIIDGEGADFRVYESDPGCSGGGASAYAVFVRENLEDDWIEIGTGNGVTSFDLSGSGFSTVRYVRMEDRASASPASTPGADIDAIEAIYLAEPTSSFELTLPFVSGIGEHYRVISSLFDHNFPGEGTMTPQPPDFEMVVYTGEVARQSNDACLKEDGEPYPLPVYRTDEGRCIWYDGHNGIDFDLEVGDEIYPAASGTIVNICDGSCIWPPSLIVMEHEVNGETYVTWYGHIAPDPDVREEWENSHTDPAQRRLEVDTTRVIGTITSLAGHLHFTVKYNNKYTDPYGWLPPTTDPLSEAPYSGQESKCLWRFGCSVGAPLNVETGGAFRSNLDDVYVSVPAQAYSESVSYRLAAIPAFSELENGQFGVQRTFQAEAASLGNAGHTFILFGTDESGDKVDTLLAPIELRVAYDETDIQNIDEDTLGLYRWDSVSLSWVEITDSNQLYEGYITGQTASLGIFALLGESKYEIYLPITLK